MSTRLIVKNLPPDCTEDHLRKFFKSYGQLTDCSLKYTKEGKFRKFAFVGFETDDEGEKALNQTNQTYMGSARLQVEKCLPFGDANKPRPWSQYSAGSSANKRKTEPEAGSKQLDAEKTEPEKKKQKTDPKFEAFLQAKGEKVEKEINMKSLTLDDSQMVKELLEGVTGDTKLSLIFLGLPTSIKQNSLKEWLNPVRVKAMKIVRNEAGAAAFVSFNRPPDVRRALQRDQQFLGGFKLTIQKVASEEPEAEEIDEEPEEATAYDRATEEAKVREEILDSGRLFIRNLPFGTKEADLQALFKKYGEVSEVQVIIDKKSGQCKGFAIVEFVFPESAVAAYAAEDGKVFKGRMMHILPGAEKIEKKTDEEGDDGKKGGREEKSSFKKDKAAKMKANAGKTHSWNALFLGPNAVAETLAEKLGVEKSDLLLGEGGETAGVRMALAETRLVREVRDFLVAQGVQLDAFARPTSKRSETVIIVKNLPAGVEEEELRRMFERNGAVEKVLIPPEAAVSALVVMGNPVDAKKAFKALAYSRFRTQPLYLEWAPGDVFGQPAAEKTIKTEKKKKTKEEVPEPEEKPKKSKKEMTYAEKMELKRAKLAEKEPESEEEAEESDEEPPKPEEPEKEEEEDVIEPDSTIFVKNLAFETTDSSLEALFRQNHRIKSAQVSKKLNPANPAKSLSMGFGFVQFYTHQEAKKAIKELQGEMLDGHSLDLKLSNRELPDTDHLKRKTVNAKDQGQSTKLIVRNLPFQTTIQEIENLFATFGEIRSIRMPKKVGTKQHRGFGFVDFLSVGEAKRAFEALAQSTHLYGRRLVLEWANEEESVEEMREKTAEKFSGEQKQAKKQKQQILAIEKDLTRIDDD